MNIDTTALATLFDTSPTHLDAAQGIASAYQLLLGGVPSVDGFTALINNAIDTNFGAGAGVAFNQENVFINVANSLVQGNTAAGTAFNGLIGGAATLLDQVTALYMNLVPAASQTPEGLAFVTRAEALAFYTQVAAERGVAGGNGPAIVAMASMANIFTEGDVDGHGDSINDLIASIRNNTSMLPQGGDVFTPIETADGTGFDSDDVVVDPNAGSTFTLTNVIDTLVGTQNNDIFIGNQMTANPGDSIDGGNGTDTLNLFGTGAADLTLPAMTSIENVSIKAAQTGDAFDVSGNADVKMIELNTFGAGAAPENVTVTVTTGQKVKLTDLSENDTTIIAGNTPTELDVEADPLGKSKSERHNVDFQGTKLTKVNLSSTGKDTDTNYINLTNSGGKLDTLVVDGAAGADILTNAGTLKTIDASASTGGVSVQNRTTDTDITFTGGMGDDRIDVGSKFNKDDKFSDDKGGKDTLAIDTLATADTADTVAAEGFEVLAFTGGGTGTLDVSKTGAGAANVGTNFNTFQFEGGLAGNTTLDNVQDGVTVNLFSNPNGNDLTVDHATDTTSNVANIGWMGDTNNTMGTLNLPDAETVNFNIDETGTNPAGLTITNLNAPDLNGATINIEGDGNLNILASAGAGLTKIDGSKSTGDLDIDGLAGAYKAATAVTVTTGAGADRVTGGAKDDTIDTGAGNDAIIATGGADKSTGGDGVDTFAYTAVAQSSGATIDTITDFTSKTDLFDFRSFGNVAFAGNAANFGAAQGLVTAGGGVQAVFQADTNTLWVDANDDGTLNNNDIQIKLDGVTALDAADFLGNAGVSGNILTLNAAAADTTNGTGIVGGAMTTALPDTINSTDAFLAGSTIDGQNGTDTLNVTTAATAAGLGAAISTNYPVLNLQAGTTGNVNLAPLAGLQVNAGAAAQVTLGEVAQNFTGSGANDQLSSAAGVDILTGTYNGGLGTDIFNFDAGDNITGATISGFETFNHNGGTVTLNNAQHVMIASNTLNGAGAADTFMITDAFTGTGLAAIDAYDLSGVVDNFTLGSLSQSVDGNAGNDNVSGAGVIAGGVTLDGGTNTDIFTTTGSLDVATNAVTFQNFETIQHNGGTLTIDDDDISGVTVIDGGATTITIVDDNVDGSSFLDFGTNTGDIDADTVNLGANNDTFDIFSSFNGTINDTGGANNFEFEGGGTQTGTFNGGAGVEIFEVNASNTVLNATLNGGVGNDELQLDGSGTNIAGATLTALEVFDLNGSTFTTNAANLNTLLAFTDGNFSTGGTDVVSLTDVVTGLAINNLDGAGNTEELETYNLADGVNNTVTLNEIDAAVISLNIQLGTTGSDVVTLANASHEAGTSNSEFVISEFEVGTDNLLASTGGTAFNGGFQSINAGGTALTVGNNSVVEINTGTSLDLQDVSADGGIEGLLAGAIGASNGTLANGNDLLAVIYDAAGNAGLYDVDVTTASADLVTGDITVELIGILNGVGVGNLTGADFS